MKRRDWLQLSLSALAARAAGRGRGGGIDPALSRRRGVAWLASRQDADGWWRSRVYGPFRDGPTLTPHVAWALHRCGECPDAVERAGTALSGLLKDGSLAEAEDCPIWFPGYLSAFSSIIDPLNREAWQAILCRHQFTSARGWKPGASDHGGWGYSMREPRFPGPFVSNLSSTRIALMALAEGPGLGFDPAAARGFVQRCQVQSADPEDGGFVFHPTLGGLNKAGSLADGRLAPYGSATADGLASLQLLPLPQDPDALRRAEQWLLRTGEEDRVPGSFQPDREVLRESVHYYYAWSWLDAVAALHAGGKPVDPRWKARAKAWTDNLVERQGADGSWVNRCSATREDDPLVATAWAVVAISLAERMMA